MVFWWFFCHFFTVCFLGRLFNGIRTSVPGLTAMKILIEGKEVQNLGGHIDISKPIGEEIAGII